jgi:class 3 adenylate cyclase
MEAESPSGTVTFLLAEGRRMIRLSRELTPETFEALLSEYQRLLRRLFEEMGGREVEVSGDSAWAAFPTAKKAALVAVAAQRAVAAHEWPYGLRPAISVGLHSGPAGIGWVGPAAARCSELCDAAEGGQIFMSQETANLLQDEELGELSMRELGEQETRRDSARRARSRARRPDGRGHDLGTPHHLRRPASRNDECFPQARPRRPPGSISRREGTGAAVKAGEKRPSLLSRDDVALALAHLDRLP